MSLEPARILRAAAASSISEALHGLPADSIAWAKADPLRGAKDIAGTIDILYR